MSTFDVVRRHPKKYKVVSLSANTNVEAMYLLCVEFLPQQVVMADEYSAEQLKLKLIGADNHHTKVLAGAQAIIDIACHNNVDTVMAAIVGASGLLPTLAASAATSSGVARIPCSPKMARRPSPTRRTPP